MLGAWLSIIRRIKRSAISLLLEKKTAQRGIEKDQKRAQEGQTCAREGKSERERERAER